MNMADLDDMPGLVGAATGTLGGQEGAKKRRESSSVESWHTTTIVPNSNIDLMRGVAHKLLDLCRSRRREKEEKFGESVWASLSLIIFGYSIGVTEPNGPAVLAGEGRICVPALENLENLHVANEGRGERRWPDG